MHIIIHYESFVKSVVKNKKKIRVFYNAIDNRSRNYNTRGPTQHVIFKALCIGYFFVPRGHDFSLRDTYNAFLACTYYFNQLVKILKNQLHHIRTNSKVDKTFEVLSIYYCFIS